MGHGAPASRRAAPLSTAPVPHNAIFGGFCAGVVQRRFRTIRANSSDHWKMAVPEFLFVAIPAQKRVEIALCGKRCATQCDFDHKLTWCGTIPRCRTRICRQVEQKGSRRCHPEPRYADRARFELAVACTTTVFKTVSLGRSDTCPYVRHEAHKIQLYIRRGCSPPPDAVNAEAIRLPTWSAR